MMGPREAAAPRSAVDTMAIVTPRQMKLLVATYTISPSPWTPSSMRYIIMASTLSETMPNSTLPARPATAESMRNKLNSVIGMSRTCVKYNVDSAKKMPRPTELISVALA